MIVYTEMSGFRATWKNLNSGKVGRRWGRFVGAMWPNFRGSLKDIFAVYFCVSDREAAIPRIGVMPFRFCFG